MGETLLNERSSRSHTIFTLNIESKLRKDADKETDGVVKVAVLVCECIGKGNWKSEEEAHRFIFILFPSQKKKKKKLLPSDFFITQLHLKFSWPMHGAKIHVLANLFIDHMNVEYPAVMVAQVTDIHCFRNGGATLRHHSQS